MSREIVFRVYKIWNAFGSPVTFTDEELAQIPSVRAWNAWLVAKTVAHNDHPDVRNRWPETYWSENSRERSFSRRWRLTSSNTHPVLVALANEEAISLECYIHRDKRKEHIFWINFSEETGWVLQKEEPALLRANREEIAVLRKLNKSLGGQIYQNIARHAPLSALIGFLHH